MDVKLAPVLGNFRDGKEKFEKEYYDPGVFADIEKSPLFDQAVKAAGPGQKSAVEAKFQLKLQESNYYTRGLHMEGEDLPLANHSAGYKVYLEIIRQDLSPDSDPEAIARKAIIRAMKVFSFDAADLPKSISFADLPKEFSRADRQKSPDESLFMHFFCECWSSSVIGQLYDYLVGTGFTPNPADVEGQIRELLISQADVDDADQKRVDYAAALAIAKAGGDADDEWHSKNPEPKGILKKDLGSGFETSYNSVTKEISVHFDGKDKTIAQVFKKMRSDANLLETDPIDKAGYDDAIALHTKVKDLGFRNPNSVFPAEKEKVIDLLEKIVKTTLFKTLVQIPSPGGGRCGC